MASPEIFAEIKEKLDRTANLYSICPDTLAEADQSFLIYSPYHGNYLFLSKDPSISHKMHTKLEAHEARDFDRNLFKLQKSDDGTYHLLNIETEKQVYVSGEDVLGMAGGPIERKALFQFEKYGDSGCFLIKNGDKYIYVSKKKAGIPPCPVIHAADKVDDYSHVFQFALVKNVECVHLHFELEKSEKTVKELKGYVYEFENPCDTEKKEQIDYKYPKKTQSKLSFEDGFQYTGCFLGGIPAVCIVDNKNKMSLIESNVPRSTESAGFFDSSENRELSVSLTINLNPGMKSITKIEFLDVCYSVPFTVEAKTADRKVLKGSGTWTGGSHLQSSAITKTEPLDGSVE